MITDIDKLLSKIYSEIQSFTDIAVVGMSGGADSTLVSLLCREALGKENVYTLHMPATQVDIDTFNSTSQMTADYIGVHKIAFPVGDLSNQLVLQLEGAVAQKLSRVCKGNTRSRLRMAALYGFSRHLGESLNRRARVMGTGNLSEDYIGYDTKGGDALADIFPIGELFKSEVYQLLEYFRDKNLIEENMINRIPSAGLWENQTDEDELGYSYDEIEKGIRKAMLGTSENVPDSVHKFVVDRHKYHKHKHEAPYVVSLRSYCE